MDNLNSINPIENSWELKQPILNRLPGLFGKYNENEVCQWFVSFFDDLLVDTKDATDYVAATDLLAETAREDWLDLLAFMSGFTGEYAIYDLPVALKRELVKRAYSEIWTEIGSKKILELMINAWSIEHDVWVGSKMIAGFTILPHQIDTRNWYFFLRLPLFYDRKSEIFSRATQIKNLYSAAYVDSRVCYDAFFCGYSLAGDPVFLDAPLSIKTESTPYTPALSKPLAASTKALDNVTPNNWRGVYALRKVKDNYRGFGIKVRRTDGALADIGFTYSGYLDTQTLLNFVGASDGFVSTWYDQSGNKNHISQADPDRQPRIIKTGVIETVSGQPAIRFSSLQLTCLDSNIKANVLSPATGLSYYAVIYQDKMSFEGDSQVYMSQLSDNEYGLHWGVKPPQDGQDFGRFTPTFHWWRRNTVSYRPAIFEYHWYDDEDVLVNGKRIKRFDGADYKATPLSPASQDTRGAEFGWLNAPVRLGSHRYQTLTARRPFDGLIAEMNICSGHNRVHNEEERSYIRESLNNYFPTIGQTEEPIPAFRPNLTVQSDNFFGYSLDESKWEFVNPPNVGGSVQVVGRQLILSVLSGDSDLWGADNTAVKLLQKTDNKDFQLEIQYLGLPPHFNQSRGLIFQQDALNWIRIDIFKTFEGIYNWFIGVCYEGGSTPITFVEQPPNQVNPYLKVSRQGNNWLVEKSDDRTTWTTISNFTHNILLTKLGFFALRTPNGAREENIAKFNYIYNPEDPVFVLENQEVPKEVIRPIKSMIDSITPTQWAFCWSTRKVNGDYLGLCMVVRRDSDDAYKNIGFTQTGDLDVTTLMAFAGSSSVYVHTWFDQTESSNNLEQTNKDNQPLIVDKGVLVTLNDKPTVLFNTARKTIMRVFRDDNFWSKLEGLSIYAVATYRPDGSTQHIFSYTHEGNNNRLQVYNDRTLGYVHHANTPWEILKTPPQDLENLFLIELHRSYNTDNEDSPYFALDMDLNGIKIAESQYPLNPDSKLPGGKDLAVGGSIGRNFYNGHITEISGYLPGLNEPTSHENRLRKNVRTNINRYYNVWAFPTIAFNSDSFNDSVLDFNKWRLITPKNTGKASIVEGKLNIITPAGSNHSSYGRNQDLQLIQYTTDLDFNVHVKMDSIPSNINSASGVFFAYDDVNYIQIALHRNPTNHVIFISTVVKGNVSIVQSVLVDPRVARNLRIKRTGRIWEFAYSSDTSKWTSLDPVNFSLDMSYMGFNISNPGGQEHRAIYDFIDNADDKLPDSDLDQEQLPNLLLETITPGKWSRAFSLRKLSSGYLGDCIEVRNSTTNETKNIGFIDRNLDVATLLDFAGGSGSCYVVTWYDQSGNGYNLTSETPSRQPMIVQEGVLVKLSNTNRPSLRFNRFEYSSLQDKTNYNILRDRPLSTFCVARPDFMERVQQGAFYPERCLFAGYTQADKEAIWRNSYIGASTEWGDPAWYYYLGIENRVLLHKIQTYYSHLRHSHTYLDSSGNTIAQYGLNNTYLTEPANQGSQIGRLSDPVNLIVGHSYNWAWFSGTISELLIYQDPVNSLSSIEKNVIVSDINNYYQLYQENEN